MFCSCFYCPVMFRSVFVLAGRILSHVHRSHEVNGPYKCHECSATFLLPFYLQQHASSAHQLPSYMCPFCDSHSRNPLILRLHCTRCRGSRGQEEEAEEGQPEVMDIGGDCLLGDGEEEEVKKQEEKNKQKED